MSARAWLRMAWPWKVADLAERAGWCWDDLCSWAIDRTSPTYSARDGRRAANRRLLAAKRASTCARGGDVARAGSCYCGSVGPASPAQQRRQQIRDRRGPMNAATFAVSAVLIAAVVTAVVDAAAAGPAEPGSGIVQVPCRRVVVDDRAGCSWQVDVPPGAELVVLDSAPADQPGAPRRGGQLGDDVRGGTP